MSPPKRRKDRRSPTTAASRARASVSPPSTVRLKLRGILEHRDVALRAVATACKMVTERPRGAAWDEFRHQVLSAVGEGFNNIVLHGNVGLAPRRSGDAEVDLRIKTSPGRIQIELRDWGPGFDPSQVQPPAIEALPESGMGLHIMQSFMDMSYRAGRPNLLKLNKRLVAPTRPARTGARSR